MVPLLVFLVCISIFARQADTLSVPYSRANTPYTRFLPKLPLQNNPVSLPATRTILLSSLSPQSDSQWPIPDGAQRIMKLLQRLMNTAEYIDNLAKRLYHWGLFEGDNIILRAKISGNILLDSPEKSFFWRPSLTSDLTSLTDIDKLFTYAAHDPKVRAVFLIIGSLDCGYAKLTEIRRSIEYFRKSGKLVIALCDTCREREFLLGSSCDALYITPETSIDLHGFMSQGFFYRDALKKIGIEPQVRNIGKYKSYAEANVRQNMSDERREVTESILNETSSAWIRDVANCHNISEAQVESLWSEDRLLTPYDLAAKKLVSGVRYEDQVHGMLEDYYSKTTSKFLMWLFGLKDKDLEKHKDADFSIESEGRLHTRRSISNDSPALDFRSNINFKLNSYISSLLSKIKDDLRSPPEFIPSGKYLRDVGEKIIPELTIRRTSSGPRIGIINAVGPISSSNSNGVVAETIIKQIRHALKDDDIKGVIIRIDSPGGEGYASDIIWREIRTLAKKKPVVASQIDLAASGGYYLSMACDQIVAEEMTLTGSIGVVLMKYTFGELMNRIGVSVDSVIKGSKFIDILSLARGFNEDESRYFTELANNAYNSFVEKAAMSRNVSLELMHKVAQGRVWTGKQALENGLVDHIGGLSKALEVMDRLINPDSKTTTKKKQYDVQIIKDKASQSGRFSMFGADDKSLGKVMATSNPTVFETGIVSPESVGCGSAVLRSAGVPPEVRYELGPVMSVLESFAQIIELAKKTSSLGGLTAWLLNNALK